MAKRYLLDEIRDFRNEKKKLIPVLLILGILGLFLPVLPGVALLFLGLVLLFPRQGNDVIRKIRSFFKKGEV